MFHSTVRLKKIKVTWITLCKLKIPQPWFSKYLFFLMVHLKVSFLSLSLAPFFSYKLDVSENQKIVVKKKIWFLSKEISRYTKKGSKKKYHVIMTFPRFISLVKHPKYKDQNDCCEEKNLILIQKISGWVKKCSTPNTNLINDIPVYVYI